MQKIILQPAFVLHSWSYRDTSAIVEFFTQDYGKVALIAKGVKTRKSRLRGILQPFRKLLITWTDKKELNVLSGLEETQSIYQLLDKSLACGFYVNELLMNMLHRSDAHSRLFDVYDSTIRILANGDNIQRILRLFERDLLDELGYGLQLEYEAMSSSPIEADSFYHYQVESGPIKVNSDQVEGISLHGSSLLSLSRGELSDITSLRESKQLMREVLNYHLGSKALKSRELLSYNL